ncbi:RNA-directed DNA methylation 4 [Bienertia sinuspersici]
MYTSTSSQPGTQLKSNMFSLSGAGFFGSIGRSINLGIADNLFILSSIKMVRGQTALALRLLLAVFSSKISSDVDRPFGDEVFHTARIASEEIGAQIVMVDRPIEITLAFHDEALDEVCRVYDVLRVDEETSSMVKRQEEISVEDQVMLGKFLPVLREFAPGAAEDIESDICSHATRQDSADEYVYDLYAVDEKIDDYPFPLYGI